MRNRTYALALGALLATTALDPPAAAQEASVAAFPVRQFQDENGVDLFSGTFTVLSPLVRIGSEEMGLTYFREVRGGTYRDPLMWNITISGSTYTVAMGPRSQVFTKSGTIYTPVEQTGATLVAGAGNTLIYTATDGTVATFWDNGAPIFFGNAPGFVIQSVNYPSGRTLSYFYHEDSYVNAHGQTKIGRRLQTVTSNTGYMMKFKYASDVAGIGNAGTTGAWSRVVNVKGLNTSVDSCPVSAFSCPETGRPELNTSGVSPIDYTDAEGRVTRYTLSGGKVIGIQLPGSSSNNISVTYTSSKVSSITRLGVTTGYAYSDVGNVRTVTVTRPGGSTRITTFDIAKLLMLTDQDELGRTTSYQYDSNNRLTRITRPEGNYGQFTYDSRGNVTEQREVSKTPGTPADVVSTASYDATCSIAVKCNKPNSSTDPRGNTTNYTYDATHGGVTAVTAPAPTGGGTRPEVRTSYTRLNSAGAPSATGIFRPTGTSTCQTGTAPSCVGSAEEVKSTVAYGQGLLPSSTSQGAGDNSLNATVAITYDVAGNLLTTDGPLAGTADTTRFRYNLNRELIGTVGPDPDGAGTLKHRAQRITRGTTGLVTKVERGTVNGQSDPDWAAFASLEEVQQDYDSNRRQSVKRMVAGGTTYALTQTSYDSRGRVDCVATRMNSSVFGSLPASACTLGTQGSFGPDRISKTIYDNASQVAQLQVAVGTTDAANERTLTYSNNGRLQTLKDAENNLTTYEYDGFDRLSKTRMPNTPQGSATSSTIDYELLSYDAASNVTNRRLRDAQNIGFTYDNLNRPTLKNLPGSEPDVTYAYDNLGRLTSASQTGHALSFSYDALGRNLTQVGPQGTVSSQWDIAGRRTKLTYPGSGLFVAYDYLVTGEMTKIRENGATSGIGVLATFAYDDLGRRTSLTFGNGVVQATGFDPVSRLSTLTNDLASTTNDLSVTFAYNPASQIASTVRTGDAYAWTAHYNQNRPYSANGLNQYTASGAIIPTYDTKGNLTSAGTTTYAYSSENMLTSATGGTSATLAYDPALRLHQLTAGANTTRFAYDGLTMIAEYDASNSLLRRHVHGPGMDEPLVWYEGSGTTDRRFLSSDERGSIVSVTDGSGAPLVIDSYDEYGIPGAGNIGRFQYTGQAWLAELGLQYSKARIYSPTLGRFLQTDPIGIAGGINLYAYVGNDPVNLVDPLGLQDEGNEPCGVLTGSRIPKCGDDYVSEAEYLGLDVYIRYTVSSSGGGGGSGNSLPVGGHEVSFLIPLTGIDLKTANAIISQADVANRINEIWTLTTQTGDEHGFFIFNVQRNNGAFTFKMSRTYVGDSGGMGHDWDLAIRHTQYLYMTFHTHPGYWTPWSPFASPEDVQTGRNLGIITAIKSWSGLYIGW